MELSPEISVLLNCDWTFFPQMMYSCSQILAGAILWNCANGEDIMINNVKVYGRCKAVNNHHELFRTKKQDSVVTTYYFLFSKLSTQMFEL